MPRNVTREDGHWFDANAAAVCCDVPGLKDQALRCPSRLLSYLLMKLADNGTRFPGFPGHDVQGGK
jgi:hypothetical protein